MTTKRLHIDIETYSPEDISSCGVYRYAEHPEFRILLFAYAFDKGPVNVIDTSEMESFALPGPVHRALTDPSVVKVAHNASFERVCISKALKMEGYLHPGQWECTMVQCARCGLPLGLGDAAKALRLEQQKMTEGKKLIQKFCRPHENLLLTSGRRVRRDDDLKSWETFKDYCKQDVETERAIDKALSWLKPTPEESFLYAVDQIINDRGVLTDSPLVNNAVIMDAAAKASLNIEAQTLTGLSNPNSRDQLRRWLEERTGLQLDSLRKSDLPDIKTATDDKEVHRVLQIRAELNKTSNSKYKAMQECACTDNRVRGLLQHHGTRTGRWAGRLVQMQNLPQNHIDDIDLARQLLKEGDVETMRLCYGNVPDTLSQLIRTAFIAPEGKTFAVCDFSAIEARVVAWLAGEEWVLDVFRGHGKIYEATAAQMYGCDISEIGKTDPRRQKGKIAVLALGYGGGVGALQSMAKAYHMDLTPEDMDSIVKDWRKANPNIVNLWSKLETAANRCFTTGLAQIAAGLIFRLQNDTMTIELPSGRLLCYHRMMTGTNRWGKASLKFQGVNQETKTWGWIETYGGKLTENIVQAVARDCLAHTLIQLHQNGWKTVFHVHDEVVCEVDSPTEQSAEYALKCIQEIFANGPEWANGLPLKGAGYTTKYYLKD